MQQFPHHYTARAEGQPIGSVATHAEGLDPLEVAAPSQFDGPGDKWSPEDLLVACAADCLILTFRAVANASKLNWETLTCEVTGTLDMVERVVQFTHLQIHAALTIDPQENQDKAKRVLEKAEKNCLITNSLTASTELTTTITISGS
ncbi:MAG: OsmC family protein [Gammaproteobacteria bacterium]|nr:OsmC family protein [Gammaproteobacteria bacterium]